jgi:hypothetical protein
MEAQMSDKIATVTGGASVMAAALLVANLTQPGEAGVTVTAPETRTETATAIRPFAAEMSIKVAQVGPLSDVCCLFTITGDVHRFDADDTEVEC